MQRDYLTAGSLAYVHHCKRRLRQLMAGRKVSQAQLSRETGIPKSSISRWLSPHCNDFMGLAEAVIITQAIGVTVHAMLPVAAPDDDHHADLINRAWLLPTDHLSALIECHEVIALGGDVAG